MYKAVIFDIDGTLTESKQDMTPEMGEALAKLSMRMPVGIMSGGNWPQFKKQFLSHLSSSAKLDQFYLFPTSAAKCLVYKDGEWYVEYNNALSPEEKKMIKAAINSVLEDTGIVEGLPSHGDRIEDRESQVTLSALGQSAPLAEKHAWDPDKAKRKVIKEKLEKIIPGFEVRVGGTTSVDVTHKGVDKSIGVKWLSEHLDVPVDRMLYVGDALESGGNDSAVLTTGIQTRQVSGPSETLEVIKEILRG